MPFLDQRSAFICFKGYLLVLAAGNAGYWGTVGGVRRRDLPFRVLLFGEHGDECWSTKARRKCLPGGRITAEQFRNPSQLLQVGSLIGLDRPSLLIGKS